MAISKRNRRGIWLLILLCVTLAYIPRVLADWNDSTIEVSHKTLIQAENKVEKQQEIAKTKKKQRNKKRKKVYKSPPAKFNPNEYSKEQWMYLGLSEKQTDVVMKFTSRGVKSNEELKKIFVIPDEVFERIKDSTFYPEQRAKFEKQTFEEDLVMIDLNSASLEELKSLPGIGDFYSNKIIEHRENLGGFIGKHQLLELWKFGTERYDKIKSRITLSENIKKININKADIDALKNHPYISYKVANSIVKMRNAHGEYQNLEDIMKSVLIDRELFNKIQPYLTL
ncbi:MAG: helix-hairpin-helix domain-containing protein [Fluviicola sp.]